MYVLEHSKRWWHEKCKIQCPDCETKLYEGNIFNMDIKEQSYKVWSRFNAANYDMQCVFTAWSHIIQGAGPPIGSKLMGNVIIRNWNGINQCQM